MEPPSNILDDYFSCGIVLFLVLLVYALIVGVGQSYFLCKEIKKMRTAGLDCALTIALLWLKILIILISARILTPFYAALFSITLILLVKDVVSHLIEGREEWFMEWNRGTVNVLCKLATPVNLVMRRYSVVEGEERDDRDAQEFEEMTEIIDKSNLKEAEEKKLLRGIAALSNTSVAEIMRPRVEVVLLNTDMSSAEVIATVVECGFSRLPVYETTADNIKGFLYIKDIIGYINDGVEDFQWQKHIRAPYFVPASKRINDLLEEFRQKKIHLAMVVDEYGGTDGIVTLEDVLEEIVGEISDESDIMD